jgi:hypothetical protein
MAPARKKTKPNHQPQGPTASSESQATTQQDTPVKPAPIDTTTPKATSNSTAQSPRPNSWYNGGSWRAKASPVTQVANESVSVAKGATSESIEESNRRPSQSVSKGVRGSRKSVPLAAEATRVHATSDASDKSRPPAFATHPDEKMKDAEDAVETKEDTKAPAVVENAPLPPEPAAEEDSKSVASAETRPKSGAWFGWWSRPDGYGSDGEKQKESNKRRRVETEEATNTPLPGTPSAQPANPPTQEPPEIKLSDAPKDGPQDNAAQCERLQPEMSVNPSSSRSWFGLWSTAQNQQAQAEAQADKQPQKPSAEPQINVSTDPAATENVTNKQPPPKPDNKKAPEERPKSSGWAFWSADKPQDLGPTPGGTQKEVGELAVADTPSQSHPEAAQFNEQPQPQQEQPAKEKAKKSGSLLRPKRGKAEKARDSGDSSAGLTPDVSKAPTLSVSPIPTPVDTPPDSDVPKPVQRGKQAQTRPNLILPSFRDSYPSEPSPGYLERLSAYLAQTLHLQAPPIPPNHVYLAPTPRRVKKAIAIGVHGFFPAPLIQKVLGQPTGTSIRFANYAAASIKNWCHAHQPDVKDVEIEKVALEGEGLVADRVTTLWKLLLNWLSHIRQADFILVACHSQGVPVAFMLVAKLIQLNCLGPNVRLGVCAMAGINMGPFLEYKSRLFGGSAAELFDFCDSSTKISQTYAEAIDVCLRHGVRASFIGSLDDQLVSLESSLYAPLSHPYVHRAVFIDGRLQGTPNFLTHLVVFALKLRNRGISDHGLLRELSAPLAGSLVGGEGHSRVYDDPAVYALAVDFALSSTDMAPTYTVPATQTAASSLLASDKGRAHDAATAKRASIAGYPSTLASANSIRRGSVNASSSLPGIAPVIGRYEPPTAAGGNSTAPNPFYLPWAVRGMLEEEVVKRDPALGREVGELVTEFEEWRPTSKVLRDVRWRLEGVRSML